jgi:DNA-binding YbaB/EbfC family protein
MTDFMKLMDQAKQVQSKLQNIQDELSQQTLTGTSGGGMVTVTADGRGRVTRIQIDESVVNPSDVEMLEDLVLVAVRDAQKRASELTQNEMDQLTRGLNLPFKLSI